YVKNVTAFYRKRIDSLGLDKTSDGAVVFNFAPQLDKTFSRGFTTYFFTEQTSRASFDISSSIGEKIGIVVGVEKNIIYIKTLEGIVLKNGDGIVAINGDTGSNTNINDSRNTGSGFYGGSYINNIEIKNDICICTLQNPINTATGNNIFRTFDIEFSKKINRENYAIRKIPVLITLNNDNFSITDKRGNTAFLSIDGNFDKALNPEKAKENIIKQLSRSGSEDIFVAEKINFETVKIPFIPLSEINNIRRMLFQRLENVRKSKTVDNSINIYNSENVHKYRISNSINNTSPYIPQAKENAPLMITRYCILQEIGQCKKITPDKKQSLYLENNGKRFLLKFHCNANPCGMEINSIDL
ncbi:MAG: U32 family peptidase, partial [Bacteroidales bacterium]|nr:U32 family peptidase [Bacteroidales bacterium]